MDIQQAAAAAQAQLFGHLQPQPPQQQPQQPQQGGFDMQPQMMLMQGGFDQQPAMPPSQLALAQQQLMPMPGGGDKEQLIELVKQVQRKGNSEKEKWHRYCDRAFTGAHDPSMHDVPFLQQFLQAYEAGDNFDSGQAAGNPEDARVLRLKGVPFGGSEIQVQQFLAEYGQVEVSLGTGADGRTNGEAMVRFMNGELAQRAMNEKQKGLIGARYIELYTASAEEWSARAAVAAMAPQRDTKEVLVERIKQIQRTSEADKLKWWNFCEIMNTGYRDPGRHDVPFLKKFVDAYDRGESATNFAGVDLQAVTSSVVRLRGVPYETQISQVVQFLGEYNIMEHQVKFGIQADGRKTGDAFVRFQDEATASHCLQNKQQQKMGARYIEVFRSSDDDFNNAGNPPAPRGGNPPGMYGMNNQSMGGMNNQMMGGMGNQMGGGMGGGMQQMGGCGGGQMNNTMMGQPDKGSLCERVKQIQRQGQLEKQKWYNFCDMKSPGCYDPNKHAVPFLMAFLQGYDSGELPSQPAMTNYLRLKGLEFGASKFVVVNFLGEFGVQDAHVVMGTQQHGRPNGEAFVGFASVELAESALLNKDKKQVGARYVDIYRSTEQDWVAAADPTKRTLGSYGMALDLSTFTPQVPMQSHSTGPPTLRIRGCPLSASNADVANFLNDYSTKPDQVVLGMGLNNSGPNGDAYVTFPDEPTAVRCLQERHGFEIEGGSFIQVQRVSYNQWMKAMEGRPAEQPPSQMALMNIGGGGGGGCGGGSGGGGYGAANTGNQQRPTPYGQNPNMPQVQQQQMQQQQMQQQPPQQQQQQQMTGGEQPNLTGGSILRLRGIPFTGGVGDVMHFLSEYSIDQSMILMGFNDQGRPSGDAFVSFASEAMAQHALQGKQKALMGQRYIELFAASQDEWQQASQRAQASGRR